MVKKSVIAMTVIFIIVFSFVSNVSAEKVVAKLGGSRMVLRLSPGEVERKSITVINDNSIPMKIELATSGELADNINLEEENFELAPETNKKVYFQIKAPLSEGTSEGKIDVKFKPEEGNGVGLSAAIIVIASGEAIDEEFEFEEINDDKSGIFSFVTNKNPASETEESSEFRFSNVFIISTLFLIVVLAILVVYAVRVKKEGSGGPRV